jgi:SAM-dependent methyltransferase
MYSLLKNSLKNQIREGTLFWSILRNVKNIAKYLLTLRFKSLYAYAHREFIARNSIFLFKDELFMASLFPKQILDKTIELFAPKSVLDIGCGTGQALDYFLEHRIDALGIEGSAMAI